MTAYRCHLGIWICRYDWRKSSADIELARVFGDLQESMCNHFILWTPFDNMIHYDTQIPTCIIYMTGLVVSYPGDLQLKIQTHFQKGLHVANGSSYTSGHSVYAVDRLIYSYRGCRSVAISFVGW